MVRKRLLPNDVVDLLARRHANQHKTWLLTQGQWPLSISLGIPTENDVANDIASVRHWVNAWASWSGPGQVTWVTRQWARLGVQQLPAAVEFPGPAEVALAVGQDQRWRSATQRYEAITQRWPQLAGDSVLGRHFTVLADYAETDFSRLFAMLGWLESNPASGLAPRQLPVVGLDTKWLERRTGVITDLLKAIRNMDAPGDFYSVCGLRRPPPRVRMRVLCPRLRRQIGGLKDIEAPVSELTALLIQPERVIIVENLETGIALPDMDNTVAFMRLGHAVSLLAELPWLQDCKAVYWGDIDTHGYAILNRARRLLPNLESAMMDCTTFLAYRDLWGEESVQSAEADLPLLTEHEREVFEGLKQGRWGPLLRLEQERIAWPEAMKSIEQTKAFCQPNPT